MKRRLYTLLVIAFLAIWGTMSTAHGQETEFSITSPRQGEKVSQREVAVRGTGTPGARVVWDKGRLSPDVAVLVDQGGRWSISVPLDKGRNQFTFRQHNPDAEAITLTVLYEVLPGAGAPTDTRIGIGPFSVDLSDWTLKFVYGAWNAAGGDEVEGMGNQLEALLLTNPDPTVAGAGMKSLQTLVDSMITFSLSLITVMFVISVWRFSYGDLQQPQGALFRLAGAIFLLGFYRLLFRYIIAASNAATYTILGGSSVEDAGLAQVVRYIVPTSALWAIVSLIALVFVLMLGFLRVMGLVYILVLYVMGPLVIPLMMDKSTQSYFDYWWRSLLRVLAWSIVWAVELKLFDAVTAMGVTGGVTAAFFAPIAAMALLFVMFKTPQLLPGPTPMQGMQMVSRQISGSVSRQLSRSDSVLRRVGSAAATGGAGAVAYGAATVGRVVVGGASRATGIRRNP
ncbi:MAG: hypothetical protein M3Q29_08015 [Chloroflexota bacterium]|nr:hypothetical protein [Chloroflexota bacterium]